MKFLQNKEISKKIIIAILLVMSFNFVSPTVSQADVGGALFKPISQLLQTIADLVIIGLQDIFTGHGEIKYGGITEIESDMYYIKYSPGIIFSGGIPGLDVNFIKPNFQGEDAYKVTKTNGEWNKGEKYALEDEKLTEIGFDGDKLKPKTKFTDGEIWFIFQVNAENEHIIYQWEHNDTKYCLINTMASSEFELWNASLAALGDYTIQKMIDYFQGDKAWTLYTFEEKEIETNETIESSAKTLQSTVSTWYKALRAIALVGLLSVLVYVGIRILISSTGQEKAKYKKMIIDWVTAICILFVLQYIMVFTLEITEKITEVLSTSVVGVEGEDTLMSGLRFDLGDGDDFSEIFPQLLMYLVLVIYTVLFTIQYLKRLVYMAFFTLIAPLIALTYPLDKIKDGQAQAFTTWIREYIFNALLQPMHLLLYTIFVSSATDLVETNPLYAVVAIGFLLPAEKFFRKMFGFDKASSANQLGAAAGGALIMNAINKMGHSSGKKAAGGSGGSGSGNSAPVRTSSSNSVSVGVDSDPTGSGGSGGTAGSLGTTRTANTHGPTMGTALSQNRSIRNGASAVRRKYLNKNTAKKAGALARRGVLGAAGAATLGTVGLAAGLATGDLGNALQYGAAGAGAGYMGANALGDNVLAGEKNLRETFKEGAIGQNEYNNLKADKEFYESDDFRNMLNNHAIGITGSGRTAAMRNAVQVYRDNGITDTGKITSAMKAGLKPEEGAYAIKLAEMIGRSGWNNPSTRKDFESRYKSKIPGSNGDKIWNSIEDLL